ncbi:MAG: peptidylprolyl isomerase [Candidatus Marinimicrobia bacterium]|nr:peptidylprolyl isomerase [Candidatus Neomarinimicrobiota bacterium]
MKRFVLLVFLMGLMATSCTIMTDKDIAVVNGNKISIEELYKYTPQESFENMTPEEKELQVKKVCDDYLARYFLEDQGDLDSGDVMWEIHSWEIRELANGAYQNLVIDKLLTEKAKKAIYDKMKYELNVSHILIAFDNIRNLNSRSRKEAEALVEKLSDTLTFENFDDLVVLYSDDPSKENNGGNFGWRQLGYFVEKFEDAAYALEPGQISGPIETDLGFHFIKLNGRRDIPIEPYENLLVDIREIIFNRWQSKFLNRETTVFDSLTTARPLVYKDSLLADFIERYNRLSTNVFYSEQFTSYDILDIFSDTLTLGYIGDTPLNKAWIIEYLKLTNTQMPPRFINLRSFTSFVNQNYIGSLLYGAAKNMKLNKNEDYIKTRNVFLAQKSASLFDKLYVFEKINPSKQELIDFYNEFKDELYSYEPRVRVREVLLEDSTFAKEIKTRAQNGESMADLATEYSIRNIGKKNKGLIPPVKKDQYGKMSIAAFNMLDGEIGGPFQIGEHFSVIQRIEYIPKTYRDLKSVDYRLKTDYRKHHMDEKRQEQKTMLNNTYSVRINSSLLK